MLRVVFMKSVLMFLGVMAGMLNAQAASAAELDTVKAEYRTMVRERVFNAVIEAVNQSTLSAQTSGRVVEVLFDVDDYVEKGDVLLRISNAEQKARLQQAQARLVEAKAEFDRVKRIFAKKAISKAEMDRASANLSAARARATEAREQLSHTVVKAPYSGLVRERQIQLGETVNPGSPLMTGLSLGALRITANIPQSLLSAVRLHNSAYVRVPEQNNRRLSLDNLTIFPYASTTSHSFRMRANLPQNSENLYPGMFVKLSVATGEESHLMVPREAVVYRSEVTGVYVVDTEGRISFRQVRTGRSWDDEGKVEVLSGLDVGEEIAISPAAATIALKEQRQKG